MGARLAMTVLCLLPTHLTVFVVCVTTTTTTTCRPLHTDAAKALLDRVVSNMQQEYAEGCPYRCVCVCLR